MKKILLFLLSFCYISSTFANSGEVLEVPDFKIQFQSPSYILEKDVGKDEYICDDTKDECKINFKILESDDTDISSKFSCSIDFGFDSSESEKCNPNTVLFGIGTWNVVFQVFENGNNENKKEKSITIINILKEEVIVEESIIVEEPIIVENIILEIPEPIIHVQSGLESGESDDIWTCKQEECKVNLDVTETFTGAYIESNYGCIWDFGGGTFLTVGTDGKCNPGYVYYGDGNFTASIKIYEKNDILHFKQKSIQIKNEITVETSAVVEDEIVIESQTVEEKKIEEVQRELIVQSGLDDSNKCREEKCKINLIYDGKFSDVCTWDFGNLEFKESYIHSCNPSFIYAKPGMYHISLLVEDSDGKEVFFKEIDLVNTFTSTKKEELKKSPSNISQINENEYQFNKLVLRDIQISSILVNPEGYDTSEYIELVNNGNYLLNLRGLQIDDEGKTGSRFYEIVQDIFLQSGGKIKFYKSETKISLDNFGDEVNLFHADRKGDMLKWEVEIPEGYVLTHENGVQIESEVEVVEVVDGDTIKVKLGDGTVQTVRLIGVDSPEKNHPTKPKEAFSDEASEFTKKILLGRTVTLIQPIDNYKDVYKRYLGYVYLKKKDGNDIFFNEILVRMGYAKAYLKYKFEYMSEIEDAQNYAQEHKLGMWKGIDKNEDTITIKKTQDKIPFSKNIKKQKKSLRIDGTTLPNETVSIDIGGKIFTTTSDGEGKYATNITSLSGGKYDVKFQVGSVEIEDTKELILENDYIPKLPTYNSKKASTFINKVEAETDEKADYKTETSSQSSLVEEPVQTTNIILFYFLYFFIFIFSCTGGFLVLKKRELI